jgi:hypothetical protein
MGWGYFVSSGDDVSVTDNKSDGYWVQARITGSPVTGPKGTNQTYNCKNTGGSITTKWCYYDFWEGTSVAISANAGNSNGIYFTSGISYGTA